MAPSSREKANFRTLSRTHRGTFAGLLSKHSLPGVPYGLFLFVWTEPVLGSFFPYGHFLLAGGRNYLAVCSPYFCDKLLQIVDKTTVNDRMANIFEAQAVWTPKQVTYGFPSTKAMHEVHFCSLFYTEVEREVSFRSPAKVKPRVFNTKVVRTNQTSAALASKVQCTK